MAVAAMIGLLLTASPARAVGSNCPLTGRGNSFQAYRVDTTVGSLIQSIVTVPLGTGIGVANERDYYGSHGFVIFSTTGQLEAYYSTNHDGVRPSVFVANGSQTIVNVGGVIVPDVGFGNFQGAVISIGSGTHYLVGFSFGSDNYDAVITFNSATCTLLHPASTLIQRDQTDFAAPGGSLPGSGQIYVPGFGMGSNLKLTVPNTRRFFVADLATYSNHVRLGFSTPAPGPQKAFGSMAQGPSGLLGSNDTRLGVWTTGTASFALDYEGLIPNVHVDGWALDL